MATFFLWPISPLNTEETKPNTTKANNTGTIRQKSTKSKPKSKENLDQQLTLILRINISAQMLSNGGTAYQNELKFLLFAIPTVACVYM